jgi:hypothetical protein
MPHSPIPNSAASIIGQPRAQNWACTRASPPINIRHCQPVRTPTNRSSAAVGSGAAPNTVRGPRYLPVRRMHLLCDEPPRSTLPCLASCLDQLVRTMLEKNLGWFLEPERSPVPPPQPWKRSCAPMCLPETTPRRASPIWNKCSHNGSLRSAAGLAGLVAGAVSIALGEYVSVSSQRDTELAAPAQGNAGHPRGRTRDGSPTRSAAG